MDILLIVGVVPLNRYQVSLFWGNPVVRLYMRSTQFLILKFWFPQLQLQWMIIVLFYLFKHLCWWFPQNFSHVFSVHASGEGWGGVLDSHQFSHFRGCGRSLLGFGTSFYSTYKQWGCHFNAFSRIYWAFQCCSNQHLHALPFNKHT